MHSADLGWKVYEQQAKAVERADTKAWIMVALLAATSASVYGLWDPSRPTNPFQGLSGYATWLYGLALLAFSLSAVLSLTVVLPNLGTRQLRRWAEAVSSTPAVQPHDREGDNEPVGEQNTDEASADGRSAIPPAGPSSKTKAESSVLNSMQPGTGDRRNFSDNLAVDLLYFGDIHKLSDQDSLTIASRFGRMSADDQLKMISRQIRSLADIAWTKYRLLRWAILLWITGASLIVGLVALSALQS